MIRELKKIFNDKEISLIFMGSSVTDGYPYNEKVESAYPELVVEELRRKFPDKNFKIENLAECGEKTACALMRCEERLACYEKGVVFLEYALNDEATKDWLKMYEGLVRKIIRYGCFVPINIVLPGKDRSATFRYIKIISEYYNIPYISVDDMIEAMLESDGRWEDYYLDATHPNTQGQILIADCITVELEKYLASGLDSFYVMPAKEFMSDSYENMKIHRWKEKTSFPQTLEVECKTMWLSYIQHYEREMGKMQVYVDGKLVENLHGRSHFCNNYPVQKKVFEFEEVGHHEIRLQMAPGDEEKCFIIENIGIVT